MRCKVYSLRKHFVCLCPSVLLLFKEAFGAFSVEKREKYHIMEHYLVWKPTDRLEDKKKLEMMDVLTSVVLSDFHTVSMLLSLKSIMPPFCKRRL